MEITLSVIIACGTAITAIIAPIFTAIINNHHQLRMKNIDMFYKEKSEAYQKFCNTLGVHLEAMAHGGSNNAKTNAYYQTQPQAYLMADNKTRLLMDKLESQLHAGNIDTQAAQKLVSDITTSMGKDLESYRKYL